MEKVVLNGIKERKKWERKKGKNRRNRKDSDEKDRLCEVGLEIDAGRRLCMKADEI